MAGIKIEIDTSEAEKALSRLKSDTEKGLRKEASRMASMANKRLKRLEKNGLTDMPAYKAWADNGSIKFGIRGKDDKEVKKEYWRLKNFLNSQSSTVKGSNKLLKNIAKNTGIKYSNLDDLKGKTKNFFKISDKLYQYYRNAENPAMYDSNQRFKMIDEYIEDNNINLNDNSADIESIIDDIISDYERNIENIATNWSGGNSNDTVFQDLD